VANLKDIIASKKASGRRKDLIEMEMLEDFADEYESRQSRPLISSLDRALQRNAEFEEK
jgi:hypothetical protein